MINWLDNENLLSWFDDMVSQTVRGEMTPLTWAHTHLCPEVPVEGDADKLCYIIVECFSGASNLEQAVEVMRLWWPIKPSQKTYVEALLHIPLELLSLMINKTECKHRTIDDD